MAEATAQELALITQFRGKLVGILDPTRLADDQFLLRWIRARDHNLEKAKLMLHNHLKWYAEKDIAGLMKTPIPDLFVTHFPNYSGGQDRAGRPILICLGGRWNMRELLRASNPDAIVMQFVRLLEILMARLAEMRARAPPGAPFPQVVAIGDCHGFGWAQANSWPAISRLIEMAATLEGHYPEITEVLFFVNCSRFFMWVIPLLKKAMAERTASKLHVYGADKDEWWPVLTKLIEPKHLQMLPGAETVEPAAEET